MPGREDLERRVEELEAEVVRLRGGRGRGIRYRSSFGLGDTPLLAIAVGPDLSSGELRGHARGVIAIGDLATGFIAIGGLARGVLAFGGLALGGLSFGGLSIGVLLAAGGVAVGSLAFGGGALGGVAVGGGAVGYYACGGAAAGAHAVSPLSVDPEARAFFREHGLEAVCRSRRSYYPAQ
jgi:hypothetical protein